MRRPVSAERSSSRRLGSQSPTRNVHPSSRKGSEGARSSMSGPHGSSGRFDMRRGEWFERACAIALRAWPGNARRARTRERRLHDRVRSLEAAIATAELELDFGGSTAQKRRPPTIERLRRERDRTSRYLEQPAFHRALEYTQLRVTLNAVLRMAVMAALGTLVFAGAALLVALALRAPTAVLALLAALVAVAPVAAYASVVSYPESLARRIRLASLGGAPEAVNYMAMSMRVAPALDRAVEFAARHTEEPL